MCFPALVALSHCWLSQSHCDPEARNLREVWLPALEWYLSERVWRAQAARSARQVDGMSREQAAIWVGMSDEELLRRCDFGVFIEYAYVHEACICTRGMHMCTRNAYVHVASSSSMRTGPRVQERWLWLSPLLSSSPPLLPNCSRIPGSSPAVESLTAMCQKDGKAATRTSTEQALFGHALHNLDLIYAHKGSVTFLSTRLPEGVGEHTRPYAARGWCSFEHAEGLLIKPPHHCIDIGRLTVTAWAAAVASRYRDLGEGRVDASTPAASKTVAQFCKQASHAASYSTGLLAILLTTRGV